MSVRNENPKLSAGHAKKNKKGEKEKNARLSRELGSLLDTSAFSRRYPEPCISRSSTKNSEKPIGEAACLCRREPIYPAIG